MLDPVCLEPLHRRRLVVANQYSVLRRRQRHLKVYLEELDRHQHTLYLVVVHNPCKRLVVQRYLGQNLIKVQVQIQLKRKFSHEEIRNNSNKKFEILGGPLDEIKTVLVHKTTS